MPSFIAGITGTNGKTSIAYLGYRLLCSLGSKAGYIGTLGVFPEVGISISLTTPDAAILHQILQLFTSKGITHVCVEISSSSLDRCRVNHLLLDIAVFSSFSPEHLDIHGTLEEYWKTKLKIATLLKKDGTFIAHEDIFYDCKKDLIANKNINSSIKLLKYSAKKNNFQNKIKNKKNIQNFMDANLEAAILICEAAGFNRKEIESLIDLTNLQVPGRIEIISTSPLIIIDYAHTPDALEKLLKQFDGDKILLFGCGGDRDSIKRKPMGEIAGRYAKFVVITDDNPRTENPAKIRKQIIEGCPKAIEISDRKKAIEYCVSLAKNESIPCIIAGKGHEKFQIYSSKKIYFSDKEIIEEFLRHNQP